VENETDFDPVIGGHGRKVDADRAIGVLAARQHGVVARRQLVALGLSARAIEHRIACGRLKVLYRGVYAVGHDRLTLRGRWMAAVLFAGDDAVLSHRSAAALWAIRATSRRAIDITVAGSRRDRAGIEYHSSVLAADERTVHDGIPVTTVARTIVDLAGVVPANHVRRAIEEADVRGHAGEVPLAALVARHPNRRGIAVVRAALQRRRGVTRGELEARFQDFLTEHGLPEPQTNVHLRIGDRLAEVDCVWPATRLVVELDGRAAHDTAAAFERDRAKDRALHRAGWRPVRVTWRQLHDEPRALAGDLRALLAAG